MELSQLLTIGNKNKNLEYSMNYDNNNRSIGVSGLLRVKNGERWLSLCIDSCINALDELIVVYHECTDRTVEILNEKSIQYPNKIKIYEYVYKIKALNLSKEEYTRIRNLPENSPELLSTYYNFGLSKINYQFCMKIDADQIYWSKQLSEYCDNIRKNPSLHQHRTTILYGINIFKYEDQIYVPHNPSKVYKNLLLPFPLNGGLDHMIFYANEDTYFIKAKFNGYERDSNSSIVETFTLCDIKLDRVYFNLSTMWWHLQLCDEYFAPLLNICSKDDFLTLDQLLSFKTSFNLHRHQQTMLSMLNRKQWIKHAKDNIYLLDIIFKKN